MTYQDRALRTYSECGIRSAEEWQSLGRVVTDGIEPRTRATSGGREISLYTRDQTTPRPPSQRARAAKLGGGAPAPQATTADVHS